ncbi:MAG: N-acetylmuramoyl-L-alanine amidase [Clostridiales bacterium]|nr:N-acetylmuramoyl-L-alanine amidase [Clostridiales bacterium]
MNLVESILTKNPCYTAGKTITVKGLMLHSVGYAQPSAAVFVKNWNSESYSRACVHAFIDGNDGTVYQTLPWNRRGWHCGSGSNGSGNNTHIGVEMCEPGSITYTSGASFTVSDFADAKAVAKRTYEAAVELFAYLCNKYKLDPAADGVILSHKEGHSRGLASNHGDPEHLWKGLGLSYTMDTFRKAVKEAMGTNLSGTSASESGSSGNSFGSPSGSSSVPYQVKVKISNLNIRKGPGTDHAQTGKQTGKGTFTIVEESKGKGSDKGWGLLKAYQSGRDGWISLDYCEKV